MGLISGPGQVILFVFALCWLWIYEIIFPKESIDIAEDFNNSAYIANPERWGNHMYDVRQKTPS
jgi:hypothetical protein